MKRHAHRPVWRVDMPFLRTRRRPRIRRAGRVVDKSRSRMTENEDGAVVSKQASMGTACLPRSNAMEYTERTRRQGAVISVEQLAKRYCIQVGHRGGRTLAETIRGRVRDLFSGAGSSQGRQEEEVWPLKGVSFTVRRGEVVGIIGRNGAGKSTLLKILSRIIDPTSGRAELHGRVGTLLEVGTGFHPELTGRDNIYLSGILLGMRRQEIDARFDEIVEFSGIGPYLDTPVKRYSSGMYVRLAFAVGAHLEPEILIVDEVLAVGDFEFQSKCLRKMQEVSDQGRTVLFVSHDMSAVSRLCPRSILLEQGQILADGPTTDVLGAYLHAGSHPAGAVEWRARAAAPGNDYVRLRAVRVRDRDGTVVGIIEIREPFTIELEYEVLRPGLKLAPHIGVITDRGERLFLAYEVNQPWDGQPRAVGRYTSRALIPGNLLTEGKYYIGAYCYAYETKNVNIELDELLVFQIIDTLQPGGARGYMPGRIPGSIRPLLQWNCQVDPLNTAPDEALSEQQGSPRR